MDLRIFPQHSNRPAQADVLLQGSKNSAICNIALPLFFSGASSITHVPDISDIREIIGHLASAKCVARFGDGLLHLDTPGMMSVPYCSTGSLRTTASRFLIPGFLHRFGEYTTGPSRGDDLGNRQFDTYAAFLGHFGVRHERSGDAYRFIHEPRSMSAITISLPFPSFGLTVLAMLGALLQRGTTVIKNACQEPELINFCYNISKMGASILRPSPTEVRIVHDNPLRSLDGINMADRNAAVTYTIASCLAQVPLRLRGYDNIRMDAFHQFMADIALPFSATGNELHIAPRPFSEYRPLHLNASLFPAFHSDWQPLVAPLLSRIGGESSIAEDLFEYRFAYIQELAKLGVVAEYDMKYRGRFGESPHPHRVIIRHSPDIHGGTVNATDLRGGASLALLGLSITEPVRIQNAQHILRGYEHFDQILSKFGVTADFVNK